MGYCRESMRWLKCYFDQIKGKTVKKEDAWDSIPILVAPSPTPNSAIALGNPQASWAPISSSLTLLLGQTARPLPVRAT